MALKNHEVQKPSAASSARRCRGLNEDFFQLTYISDKAHILAALSDGVPMADESQLETLKRGVDVWNQWRQQNPSIRLT